MNLTGNKINVIVWHMEMNGNVENYMKELWGIMKRCKILRAVGTDGEKKNNIYAGCNIDIWMRENISEQIIQIRSRRVYRNPYRFSGCGNQNDKKKIEKLFAKNVSGEKFEKQPDKFLEFYSETIKDGTLDKDSILMRVTGSQDRNFYRIMDSGAKITKGDQTYYIYMEVVTADKEHPENKEIQIIDLATKKAYNDRYFLWHSKKGIFTQEKVCEDYRTMLIYGNLREYYPVDRELSVQYFRNFIKRSTDYKELQTEIGKPNEELLKDEFVFEITQGVDEKTYVTCETCGDEIIRIKLVNEEEVLEKIYEKDSEND